MCYAATCASEAVGDSVYVCLPQVIVGPEKMIVVPPRHYCVIENPAMKDKDGKPVFDTHGQVCAENIPALLSLIFMHTLIHST